MSFKLCLILSSFCLFFKFSYAKVYVISDLDDTVRKSNVLNLWDAARRLVIGVKPYTQMRDMYQYLDQAEFFYISSSHRYFYNAKKWLDKYEFPTGGVFQKKFRFKGDVVKFKKSIIKKVLQESNTEKDQFIFLGDNSDLDGTIYSHIVRELKLKHTHIFIRDVKFDYLKLSSRLLTKKVKDKVIYFLSEKDLFKHPFFSFVPPWINADILKLEQSNNLVPKYLKNNLRTKVKREICRRIEQKDKRKSCRKNSMDMANKLVKKYLARF